MSQKIGHQARQDYQRWQGLASAEAVGYTELRAEVEAALEELRTERNKLAAELAEVYLTELSEPALMAAERRTGFRGFSKRSPIQALPREREKLTKTVEGIEAEPRYVDREKLVGPYGTLTRKHVEAQELWEPWQKEAQRFEAHEGFLELVEVGYDTPAFTERWWQPSYWRHWATGDRICAALGLADFGDDILPVYLEARQKRDDWQARIVSAETEIQAVHDLVKRHDELAWRRDNLEQVYLDEGRTVLVKHLLAADVQLLATWAEEDRGIIVLLKRFAGLHAKEDILMDMRDRWVEPQRQSLADTAGKFQLKAGKLVTPRKAGMQVVVPDGVDEKLATHQARREKARNLVRRIRTYDAYDRYNFSQPPETWYLHFTGNRRPSAFTPQYNRWYQSNPTVVVVTDPAWEDDRVDLSSGPELADTGDIS